MRGFRVWMADSYHAARVLVSVAVIMNPWMDAMSSRASPLRITTKLGSNPAITLRSQPGEWPHG